MDSVYLTGVFIYLSQSEGEHLEEASVYLKHDIIYNCYFEVKKYSRKLVN